MASATSDLKQLHHLLVQLEEIEDRIRRGPRRVAASTKRAEEKEAELEEKKEALTQLRKTGDAKSLQMKTNEAKIVELKVKLNTVTTNREFDIVKGQIQADEMANSVLEDEILEVYEKIDAAEQGIKDHEQVCQAARADEKKVADEVAAAEEGLKSQADALRKQIAEAETCIPEGIRDKYDRLIAAHGAGALTMVEDSVCTACYVTLEPQLYVEVKAGKFVFCKHCGRLAYLSGAEG